MSVWRTGRDTTLPRWSIVFARSVNVNGGCGFGLYSKERYRARTTPLGLGVSHVGGPVTEKVAGEILSYLEARLKRQGLKEVRDWKDSREGELDYWKVSGPMSQIERQVFDKSRSVDQDLARRYPVQDELDALTKELDSASASEKPLVEYRIRGVLWNEGRPKLRTPPDFEPTDRMGIIANLDPHAESLVVIFTRNGSRNEWRDLGDYTKTSFIDPWPGVQVVICEILHEIQRRVWAAGGDYGISDETELCDDFKRATKTSLG